MSRSDDKNWLVGLIAAVVILGLWYAVAAILVASHDPIAEMKLPYPHLVVKEMGDDAHLLLDAAWTSLSTALLGFAIGASVAFVLSVIMVQASWAEAAVMPYLLAAQMIPAIAMVPIAQVVFKSDTATRLFICAFVTVFSVVVATVQGLKSPPPGARELMRSYNASRLRFLRTVELPACLPMLFAGLRVAAPLSLIGSVLVDLSGAQSGLGYLMLSAYTFGPSHALVVWASMVVLLVLGFLLTQAVAIVERAATPWRRRDVGTLA